MYSTYQNQRCVLHAFGGIMMLRTPGALHKILKRHMLPSNDKKASLLYSVRISKLIPCASESGALTNSPVRKNHGSMVHRCLKGPGDAFFI